MKSHFVKLFLVSFLSVLVPMDGWCAFSGELPVVLQSRNGESGAVELVPETWDAMATVLVICGAGNGEMGKRIDQVAAELDGAGVLTIRAKVDSVKGFVTGDGSRVSGLIGKRGSENVVVVAPGIGGGKDGVGGAVAKLTATDLSVVLVRDLTSSPQAVAEIEKSVCATISSEQVVGGEAFRASDDERKDLLIMIGEKEYRTAETLPKFATEHLVKDFRVSYSTPDPHDPNRFVGLEALQSADALLVSVRRRALPEDQLAMVREHVAAGKAVVGIRTASHAFSLRGKPAPEGNAVWDEWDAEVFGGNYSGHHKNDLKTSAAVVTGVEHPILEKLSTERFTTGGSLYEVLPLAEGATALLSGRADTVTEEEPVAWVFRRKDGGKSFYTSLGHVEDFGRTEFTSLFQAAIGWVVADAAVSSED